MQIVNKVNFFEFSRRLNFATPECIRWQCSRLIFAYLQNFWIDIVNTSVLKNEEQAVKQVAVALNESDISVDF